jgi:hypothetical protein
MKTINNIKLTDEQLRQIVAPSDGPTSGDKAVLVATVLVFVWLLARHDRMPAVNDDSPSSVTEVLICAAILGLSSVLAAFLFFALIS